MLVIAIMVVRRNASRQRARIKSIAVLPLANLSGDPEQDYFSDGMTDEVIHTLAQIPALRITSRTSIMQYKGTRKPIPQIARELNVDGIVEGSILRFGDRVRISVDLIQGATDQHLWTASYERDLRDIVALQDEVAREVAHEVNITLTDPEHKRLAHAEAVDPAARESYLRGRFFLSKATEEGARKSVEYFETSIRQQPRYAQAYAGLAQAYQELAFYDSPRAVAPKAKLAPAPISGSPEQARFGSHHPRTRHPEVAFFAVCPVAGCP